MIEHLCWNNQGHILLNKQKGLTDSSLKDSSYKGLTTGLGKQKLSKGLKDEEITAKIDG